MNIIASALVVCAASVLVVLAIDVIGAMRRRGGWAAWLLWLGVACAALLAGLQGAEVPLPVALLLLVLAGLLWRQRGRLRWAASHGRWW